MRKFFCNGKGGFCDHAGSCNSCGHLDGSGGERHMVEASKGEQMYTLYHGDKPVAYRYGEEWVAQELLMEGGFKTEAEAREHWEKYKEERYGVS